LIAMELNPGDRRGAIQVARRLFRTLERAPVHAGGRALAAEQIASGSNVRIA
jgi:hypothetical protein